MIFTDDLTVIYDANGTMTEVSEKAYDYGRDFFDLVMASATDHLYVGLYKPFKQLYLAMKVVNSTANSLTAQYWNGSTWNNLSNFLDQSVGFTKDGFMKWTKPTDWAKNIVNGDELYWVRFVPSADFSMGTQVLGLNIIFADDTDLVTAFSKVRDYLGSTQTSFVTYHQMVRDDLVQSLRNKGNSKQQLDSTITKNITKWDLLDADEIKNGAIYACLAMIFQELSDNPEDKWYQRYKDYKDKASEKLEVFYLSLDVNDDGEEDQAEILKSQGVSLTRV